MEKKISKLLSMLLAAVMVLSMAMTGLAAPEDEAQPMSSSDDTSFTITINPAYSGEIYTAYKIFDVTYSDEDDQGNISYSYTIDANSAWYDTVSSSGLFTLTQITGTTTYNVAVNDGVTGEQIAAALSPVPDGADVAATVKPEFEDKADGSSGSGSVTLDVSESGPGYYFVTTSLGSVVSIDTTNPTVTISDKNPAPTITKDELNESHGGTFEDGAEGEGSQDTAKVGDIIEFQITIKDAANKSNLVLHDTMGKGLTLQSDSIKVYLNDFSESSEIQTGNYTITLSDFDDDCVFEITFDPSYLSTLNDDDVIYVIYEAVINEEAVEINNNDASLDYGTGGHSVTVGTETDVYGLSLIKVDDSNEELDGATFTLAYGDSFGTTLSGTLVEFYYDEDTNTYIVHDSIDEKYEDEETTTEILVGSATIFGLDVGTYTLTETKAPDGYNNLESPITVTIADDGTVSISGNTLGSLTDGTINVINNSGSTLPSTGGMGTTIFYIVGIILIIGAAVLFITKKRLDKEQ